MAIEFEGLIKQTKAYDRNYDGPPLETLPVAEVFDKLSSLYCKDERTGAPATRKEKPHSYTTAKYLTIWTFADPVYYVMGLADAFSFLSAKTGYQRGLSDCYKKFGTNRGKLLTSFRSYIKTPKTYDKTYAGPSLKNLPAAEVFDKFSLLYCKDKR